MRRAVGWGTSGDAVDDDEERIRRVADLRDGGPHRHLDDPGELRNATQLILVELTEEGDALQVSSLRIAGRYGRGRQGLLSLVGIMKGQAIRGS